MAGKRKIPAQRAIEFAGILAGCSCGEVNEMLASAGFPDMNENSYHMVKKQYIPFLQSAGPEYIKEHLYSPRRRDQLRST